MFIAEFEKEGYGMTTVDYVIQIKTITVSYTINLFSSDNVFKLPSKAVSRSGTAVEEMDNSYRFVDVNKELTLHLGLSISPSISIEEARVVFGSSRFWKPLDKYAQSVNDLNEIQYNIKVSDGQNYSVVIGAYIVKTMLPDIDHLDVTPDQIMRDAYLKPILIPFDLYFKEYGDNIWHKVVIPVIPVNKGAIATIVCPYSTSPKNENKKMDTITSIYSDKISDLLTKEEIIPYSQQLDLSMDLVGDVKAWYEFLKPRDVEQNIPEFLDFTSSALTLASHSMLDKILWGSSSAASLYLLPPKIVMDVIYCLAKEIVKNINYEHEYYNYGSKSQKYTERANEELNTIYHNRYYTYQETHLKDDEKHWWDGNTVQGVEVINTGVKKMRVDIKIYPLLEDENDGSISWGEVMHKTGELLPGQSLIARVERASPLIFGQYNRGFFIEIITDYDGLITYTTYNKYGLGLMYANSISFENNGKEKTVFSEGENIKMHIEAFTKAISRFNHYFPIYVEGKIKRKEDGKIIDIPKNIMDTRTVKNRKEYFVNVYLDNLEPGEYYVDQLQIYAYSDGKKLIFYKYYAEDQLVRDSPWKFFVISETPKINAQIKETHSFNITTCINANTSLTINSTIYSPDGRVENATLDYIEDNCYAYHFANDIVEGTYYIFLRINGGNWTRSYFMEYTKINETSVQLYNLSYNVVIVNNTLATLLSGRVKNRYPYNVSVNLSIDLPLGVNIMGSTNNWIELAPNESKYFEWILYSDHNYKGKVFVTIYNNSRILDIAPINIEVYRGTPLPSILLKKQEYVLSTSGKRKNITLSVMNPCSYKINYNLSAINYSTNLSIISLYPTNFTLDPYQNKKINLSFEIKNFSDSYEINLQFNATYLDTALKKIWCNVTIFLQNDVSFEQPVLIFINPFSPLLNVSINISNRGIYTAKNVSILSDSPDIEYLPINFSILSNQTIDKYILINATNYSENNNIKTYYLFLSANNRVVDSMAIQIFYLPDLRIKSIVISQKNQDIYVDATISNIGKINATNISVELYIDDFLKDKTIIPVIKNDEQANTTFIVQCSYGWHNITVKINTTNTLYNWNNLSKILTEQIFIPVQYAFVNITPCNKTVSKNETFSIEITVDPVDGVTVAGVQCDLLFNASLLEVISVEEGDLFNGYQTYFMSGEIDNINGSIKRITSVALAGQTTNKGSFAIITFRVKGEHGISCLNLTNVIVGDVNAQRVPIKINNGTVEIKTCPYDLNGDGDVNILDMIIVAMHWLETSDDPNWDPKADINGDNVINVLDLILVGQHFGMCD